MIPLNIPVDGKTVLALLFETDRAPFVVKNPDGKLPHREVPWRENISIRTAKRSDLIKLLTPLEKLPEIEIIDLELNACIGGRPNYLGAQSCPDQLYLESNLYIVSKNRERIIIPFHRCKVIFKIGELSYFESNYVEIYPYYEQDYLSKLSQKRFVNKDHQIVIDIADKVVLRASAKRPNLQNLDKKHEVHISIYLQSVNTKHPVILSRTLPYPEEKLPS